MYINSTNRLFTENTPNQNSTPVHLSKEGDAFMERYIESLKNAFGENISIEKMMQIRIAAVSGRGFVVKEWNDRFSKTVENGELIVNDKVYHVSPEELFILGSSYNTRFHIEIAEGDRNGKFTEIVQTWFGMLCSDALEQNPNFDVDHCRQLLLEMYDNQLELN